MGTSKIPKHWGLPDYSNCIRTMSGTDTYTASNDCFGVVSMYGSNTTYADVQVDGVEVLGSYNPSSAYTTQRGTFLARAGSVIKSHSYNGCHVEVKIYPLT